MNTVIKLKLALFFILIHLSSLFIFSFLAVSPSIAETSFLWPLQGRVVSEYRNTGYQAGGHFGIDIEAGQGNNVYAPADGKVYWIGKTPSGECGIGLEHEDGKRTTYLPVSVTVARNQAVKQGDVIATVLPGHGSSSVTSLHFAIKTPPYDSPNDYMNPLEILPSLSLGEESQKTADSQVSGTQPITSSPVGTESSMANQGVINPITSPVQEEVKATADISADQKAVTQNANLNVSVPHTTPDVKESISANISPLGRNGVIDAPERVKNQISRDAKVNKASLRSNVLNNWLQAILISIVPLLILLLMYKGRAASGILPRLFAYQSYKLRSAN